jgi:hypothetical protein
MKKRTIVQGVVPLSRAAFRVGRCDLHDGDLPERLLAQALGGLSSELIPMDCATYSCKINIVNPEAPWVSVGEAVGENDGPA